MNYWSSSPNMSPPEPRDHWYDCPANPHNGGEEDECECDEITDDKWYDDMLERRKRDQEDWACGR